MEAPANINPIVWTAIVQAVNKRLMLDIGEWSPECEAVWGDHIDAAIRLNERAMLPFIEEAYGMHNCSEPLNGFTLSLYNDSLSKHIGYAYLSNRWQLVINGDTFP